MLFGDSGSGGVAPALAGKWRLNWWYWTAAARGLLALLTGCLARLAACELWPAGPLLAAALLATSTLIAQATIPKGQVFRVGGRVSRLRLFGGAKSVRYRAERAYERSLG